MIRLRLKTKDWPEARRFVFARDKGCLGPRLGAPTECSDDDGNRVDRTDVRYLEAHHVQHFGTMGKKAPDMPEHLVAVCRGHHRGQEAGYCWGTSKEGLTALRGYLTERYPEHWSSGDCVR